jgi:hypothetical protein
MLPRLPPYNKQIAHSEAIFGKGLPPNGNKFLSFKWIQLDPRQMQNEVRIKNAFAPMISTGE